MKVKPRILTQEEFDFVKDLKVKYGSLFEVTATSRNSQEYIGYFRPLTISDYDTFLSAIRSTNEEFTDLDVLLKIAKLTFVAGDDEMLDEEKHFDIVNSYINKIYDLLDPRYTLTSEENGLTVIKLIDIPIVTTNILDYDLEWNAETKMVTLVEQKATQLDDKTSFRKKIEAKYYEAKFRYPSLKDYKRYLMIYDTGNVVSAGMELAKMCLVEGDSELTDKNYPSFVYSATKYFTNILKTYDSTLKKKSVKD